jgi:hypothetical protein
MNEVESNVNKPCKQSFRMMECCGQGMLGGARDLLYVRCGQVNSLGDKDEWKLNTSKKECDGRAGGLSTEDA